MKFCDRCGVEVPAAGLCRDCREVEEPTIVKEQRTVYGLDGSVLYVSSSFAPSARLSAEQHEDIRRRSLAGESVRQIAVTIGCSSRAVSRERTAMRAAGLWPPAEVTP